VFNDFDGTRENSAEPKEQATAYPHLLAPDDWSTYQGAIPTIAWESLREGVDDYAYLYTATTLAQEAAGSLDPDRRAAGQEALATLEGLAAAVPWDNPMDAMTFKANRLQHARRVAAEVILSLQEGGSGNGRTAPHRLLLKIVTVAPVAPAAPTGVMPVLPASVPPRVDGRLDDPAWQTAASATGFRDARSGQPASVSTTARVLYDDQALYIAFDCVEPAMGTLVARQQGHDTPEVWLDDGLEVFIAGAARRPYAHVIVNTNGAVYDEINQDPSWNPAVQAAVHKGDQGWTAELAIPWADLQAAGIPRAPVLALNLCRNRFAAAGEAAHTAWSCTFGGFHTPERFGLALLQSGPVALAAVDLPVGWGSQTLGLTLRNLTDQPLTAQAGLEGAVQTVSLSAGGSGSVQVPIVLRSEGKQTVCLLWGLAGQSPVGRSDLVLAVPAPITVPDLPAFAGAEETVEIPVTLNLAAADRRHYALRLCLDYGDGQKRVELRAEPGQRKRLAAKVQRRAHVQLLLVDRRDGSVAARIERSVFAAGR
jgi:hypothetical protein